MDHSQHPSSTIRLIPDPAGSQWLGLSTTRCAVNSRVSDEDLKYTSVANSTKTKRDFLGLLKQRSILEHLGIVRAQHRENKKSSIELSRAIRQGKITQCK
ncbi:uncharacterized protein N7473_011192 [Penicillium subrubescens]|uniref:uncharacterized protein n=1 Tax=Penicillium subrubescens TaxID=1316194 RepID=UPI00254528A6|nr:uncharacterized protein N7473_011192 [Penicillium subrubescens]KAJ5882758.1 hypothetical protein N7473_011192 [Penicillium subrubescens]